MIMTIILIRKSSRWIISTRKSSRALIPTQNSNLVIFESKSFYKGDFWPRLRAQLSSVITTCWTFIFSCHFCPTTRRPICNISYAFNPIFAKNKVLCSGNCDLIRSCRIWNNQGKTAFPTRWPIMMNF